MDLTVDNAPASWSVLEQHMLAFQAAWERSDGPPIAPHLPSGASSLRKLLLVELVKIDLDYRFARGDAKMLEDYAAEFAELCDSDGPPCDLIYEEYHVRRSKGYIISRDEYFERFPGRRDELERLLGAVDASQTTALIKEKLVIDLKEGDQVDDFDLLALVGQGAFGAVFLARQRSISRLVALKVSADRGQEARMLAQLDHPNIVRVYDQRRIQERQLRLVYMQFASGGTLADLVACARRTLPQDRNGSQLVAQLEESAERHGLGPMVDPGTLRMLSQLTWPEVVCRLGAQLAKALDYAHRQGVLHRDVKPANILLAADGTPKLADFNISSLTSHPHVGAAAYFGGSLPYMSPEHLEAFNPQHERSATELDGRSDLYSLAVVLWELLCGEKPFYDSRLSEDWGETLDTMTARRKKSELQKPTLPSSEAAHNLLGVLKHALSPEVQDRPQSGEELAQELLLCVQPTTQRLLRFSGRGWREWVRQYPFLAVLLVVTLPNALAGGFNYFYNRQEIIRHIADPDDPSVAVSAVKAFNSVQLVINVIAFPLGAALVWLFVLPVAKRIKHPRELKTMSPEALAALRRYALRLGHLAAVIGLTEWVIAGLIYPVAIHAVHGTMPVEAYPHFWISLALCGLVAAAYPFFGVTFLAVRVFFPALLVRNAVDEEAEVQLRRLAHQAGMYFLIACGVPFVGVLLIIIFGAELRETNQRLALTILSLVSLAGLAFIFKTYGVILRDISALIQVVKPADPFGIETASTGSR